MFHPTVDPYLPDLVDGAVAFGSPQDSVDSILHEKLPWKRTINHYKSPCFVHEIYEKSPMFLFHFSRILSDSMEISSTNHGDFRPFQSFPRDSTTGFRSTASALSASPPPPPRQRRRGDRWPGSCGIHQEGVDLIWNSSIWGLVCFSMDMYGLKIVFVCF